MSDLATHEKIETIVNSFLASRTQVGIFGDLFETRPGRYRIYADGKLAFVRCTSAGWRVKIGSTEGIDSDLLTAARLALS